MVPKYLESFRRAAREGQTCEKSELNSEGVFNSLNSHFRASEKSDSGAAKVAKVGASGAVCTVCHAPDDLWKFGGALVHQECVRFLPKPEPAAPSLAYQAVSAQPDGPGCSVTIVEIPREAGRYRRTFAHLQLRPPAFIPQDRWRQCVKDAKGFLAAWGVEAQRLGWTSADLFGLHKPPGQPHPSYQRLSRYDCTGLIWLLQGRPVTMLTEAAATIQNSTGNVTVYRKPISLGTLQ